MATTRHQAQKLRAQLVSYAGSLDYFERAQMWEKAAEASEALTKAARQYADLTEPKAEVRRLAEAA